MAGVTANEATGEAVIWSGAAVGTAIEPGGGTLVGGGAAWIGDQVFGWSDAAGLGVWSRHLMVHHPCRNGGTKHLEAAQEYELRINGRKVRP